MSNKEVIVIGGDHNNTLWVCRSLAIGGYRPLLIIYGDTKRSFVAKSRYVYKSYYSSNEKTLLNLLLTSLCFVEKVVLITASDVCAEIIDKNLDILKDKYYTPSCHDSQGLLAYWMDKATMLKLAGDVGFNVASTKTLNLCNDVEVNTDSFSYPCLIKPKVSSHGSKTDFRICYSKSEMEAVLKELKMMCPEILVQEYLKPDYEINVMGVSFNDICILPGLGYKNKVCSSVHNMGMNTLIHTDENVEQYVDVIKIKRFIREIGYNGIFSIEFLIHNGVPYFLEVNLRTDGTMFIHTSAGVNLPQIWADLLYYNSINSPTQYKRNNIIGMTEFSYLQHLDWKSPINIIKDWWHTDCYSIFLWTDMKPFIYKIIYALF